MGVTVTVLAPALMAAGTVATMRVAVQEVVVAAVPLKLTAPVVPRLVPVIVTLLPARPLTGESVLSTGAAGAGAVTV